MLIQRIRGFVKSATIFQSRSYYNDDDGGDNHDFTMMFSFMISDYGKWLSIDWFSEGNVNDTNFSGVSVIIMVNI